MSEIRSKAKAMRAPVVKPIVEAPIEKVRREAVYELGDWKGKELFQCSRCRFNSLSERTFWEHWAMRHQPPRPTPSGLVGPDGKLIEPKEE